MTDIRIDIFTKKDSVCTVVKKNQYFFIVPFYKQIWNKENFTFKENLLSCWVIGRPKMSVYLSTLKKCMN